jgi:hypothetical protein
MARNIIRIAGFNFRGSTLKTFLGLEDERRAFDRYRAIRTAERNYLEDSAHKNATVVSGRREVAPPAHAAVVCV